MPFLPKGQVRKENNLSHFWKIMELTLQILQIVLSLTILYTSIGTIAFIRRLSREDREIEKKSTEYYPPPEILEPKEEEVW